MRLSDYATAMAEDRVIFVSGEINEDQLGSFRRQLQRLLSDPTKREAGLVLSISSAGGRTRPGMSMYNEVRAANAITRISVVGQYMVHSMAVYVSLGVPKEQRFAMPMTSFYLHAGAMDWKVDYHGPAADHLRKIEEYQDGLRDLEQETVAMVKLVARGTGQPEKSVRELFAAPRHIYEEEAMGLGLISGILT